ncbi:hypothetical protein Agabi119p4_6831 [Agaricus bisporus var. burnettii]|uniref:Uncharacterized protein n=1 Tax=Agaricus bisporus var. burnettii TaxID=192524 RepID=A0A8H7F099_AGABI|nr:hypothetical protein Agabi119p4_6831 [Agaricus bisporus var. burnettii]
MKETDPPLQAVKVRGSSEKSGIDLMIPRLATSGEKEKKFHFPILFIRSGLDARDHTLEFASFEERSVASLRKREKVSGELKRPERRATAVDRRKDDSLLRRRSRSRRRGCLGARARRWQAESRRA